MKATTLFIDNNGAFFLVGSMMVATQKMTMSYEFKIIFTILNWVERDLVFTKRIIASDNSADINHFGRKLFHNHNDYILEKVITKYAASYYP